jgi:hypothetical protein
MPGRSSLLEPSGADAFAMVGGASDRRSSDSLAKLLERLAARSSLERSRETSSSSWSTLAARAWGEAESSRLSSIALPLPVSLGHTRLHALHALTPRKVLLDHIIEPRALLIDDLANRRRDLDSECRLPSQQSLYQSLWCPQGPRHANK